MFDQKIWCVCVCDQGWEGVLSRTVVNQWTQDVYNWAKSTNLRCHLATKMSLFSDNGEILPVVHDMSSSDIFDVGSPGLIWWTIPVIIFNFWRGKQKALEFCYGQRSESVKVFLLAHGSVLNKRSIIRLFTMGQWPRWGNSTAKASECADVRAPKVGSQTSPSEEKGRTNAINGKKTRVYTICELCPKVLIVFDWNPASRPSVNLMKRKPLHSQVFEVG